MNRLALLSTRLWKPTAILNTNNYNTNLYLNSNNYAQSCYYSTNNTNNQNHENVEEISELEKKRKKLFRLSRNRGMKENDLLLSTFANKYLKDLSPTLLHQFGDLMDQLDPDIYNWITKVEEPPKEFNNEIMQMIRKHALSNPLNYKLAHN